MRSVVLIVSNEWLLLLRIYLSRICLGFHARHVHIHPPGPVAKIGSAVHSVEPLTNGNDTLVCPAVMTVFSRNELRLSTNPTFLSYHLLSCCDRDEAQ